ncbi:MAG: hypothetical protein O3B24_11300 [Verrucomicrobia bacterium]|nr:hypothetical protein [Verrucomicrobiota bacterium]
MTILIGTALAADQAPAATRFVACANKAGAGFFWVDTTRGRAWWANPGTDAWEYFGEPENVETSPEGTFMPMENRSGEGLYIVNTTTGAGWWTNGRTWKVMGLPVATAGEPSPEDRVTTHE